MKIKRVNIHACYFCGKTVSERDSFTVYERKNGILTGRVFHVCPKCMPKYMNQKIKVLPTLKLDDKLLLQDWLKQDYIRD